MNARARSLIGIGWLALGSLGCGIKHVGGDILSRLPYEAKIELLEAENDLAIAVDRLDEAHSEILRARDQIRRAKDRLSAAESEVGRATNDLSREVARLAVDESEKRLEWLRHKQDVNVEAEGLAEHGLTCAKSRYEEARLTAARKAKLEGSEQLDPKEFQAQSKRCDAEYDEKRKAMKAVEQQAETARMAWDTSKATLAKKTFDARASPYVE